MARAVETRYPAEKSGIACPWVSGGSTGTYNIDSDAVIDGGFKAVATDRPFRPVFRSLTGVTYGWGGDEHGILTAEQEAIPLELGDRVEFLAPHCDPTVNLYDSIHALKGDVVDAVWAITARGKSQ